MSLTPACRWVRGDPTRQPPSNALGSAWSLRTIRIVEETPVFPPDMQVLLIVVGVIKRRPLEWPRMTRIYIVLPRAINAGGVNSLPMKDFV